MLNVDHIISRTPGSVCKICGGAGFLRRDVSVDHPDFGRAVPCECKVFETAKAELMNLRKVNGLSQLSRMTFEAFRAEWPGLTVSQSKSLKSALDAARNYANRSQGWLIIKGGYGCGKTHLAAAIANERFEHVEPVLFVLVPDLLDHLRAAFAPSSESAYDDRFESVKSAPFLVLDDFGSQSATPWAGEKLFQILNHRYNAQLPTVITTNYELEEVDPRIRSRLTDFEFCKIIGIHAPDYRQGRFSKTVGSGKSRIHLYEDMTFETFRLDRPMLDNEERENLQMALRRAKSYAKDPSGFIVFTGAYGCGKTHLAAAIANEIEQHDRTLFQTVPDLLDHLRAAFAPTSNVSYDRRFEDARNIPYLVLDDLGTENATPWAREKLFQIIDHRYVAQLPTIITVNHEAKMDLRIQVRIFDQGISEVIDILAPTYRTARSRQREKTQTHDTSSRGQHKRQPD